MPCHCGHKVLSTVMLECETRVDSLGKYTHIFTFDVDRHFKDILYRIYSNSGYRYSFQAVTDFPLSFTKISSYGKEHNYLGYETDVKYESIYTDYYHKVDHRGYYPTHYLIPLFQSLKYIVVDGIRIELISWKQDSPLPHQSYRIGEENDNYAIQGVHPFYIPECLSSCYFIDSFAEDNFHIQSNLKRDISEKPMSNLIFLDHNLNEMNLFERVY